jgi:hypothetical protein
MRAAPGRTGYRKRPLAGESRSDAALHGVREQAESLHFPPPFRIMVSSATGGSPRLT